MLHDIHLYGHLAEKYGAIHRYNITSVPQCISALCVNKKGFSEDFRDGHYKVILGDVDTGLQLDDKSLGIRVGNKKAVHFIPVAAGGKGSGGLKIVAGLALMAPFMWEFAPVLLSGDAVGAGFADIAGSSIFPALGVFSPTYGGLALAGLSMLVGGISQLITHAPKVAANTSSYLFGGQINKTQQGNCVPVVYGIFRCGSVVGSAGMSIEQLL